MNESSVEQAEAYDHDYNQWLCPAHFPMDGTRPYRCDCAAPTAHAGGDDSCNPFSGGKCRNLRHQSVDGDIPVGITA